MRSLLLFFLLSLGLHASPLPESCQQLIVGIAPDWNSSHVTLHFYEGRPGSWKSVGQPWKGRLGKHGLAWGRGRHTIPAGAKYIKKEGDRRSPAGVFDLGRAYGYAATIQRHPNYPYKQITNKDLFVEDTRSPHYNSHILLDHIPKTRWEKKQQMRQNDHAHSLKLFIAHNPPPQAIPGAGSAIFFHIWRGGGSKATFGCTTMPEQALKHVIARLHPGKDPHYILLTKSDYTRLRSAWRLP